MKSKGFIIGTILGSAVGLIIGAILAALFWNDVAAGIRKLIRHLFKRDEQVNFEILLQ